MPFFGRDRNCDNNLSHNHPRTAFRAGENWEYSAQSPMKAGFSGMVDPDAPRRGSSPERASTSCESCHYWLPYGMMPRVGLCDNPSSRHFSRAEFSDKRTEECFVGRLLNDLEFMWCQTHRQTIHATDISAHEGCSLFVSSASLPVEDEVEMTLAGD